MIARYITLLVLLLTLTPPLACGGEYVLRKTTLARASTTTLADDDVLTFPVRANTLYLIDVFLHVHGDSLADIQYTFTCPTGAAFHWGSPNGVRMGVTGVAVVDDTALACGTAIGSGINAAGHTMIIIHGTLTMGATPGNFTLQWAQNISNVTATELRYGSYIKLDEME